MSRPFQQIWADCLKHPFRDQEHSPTPVHELMSELAQLLDVEIVEEAEHGHGSEKDTIFLMDLSSLGFAGMDINAVLVSRPAIGEGRQRDQARLLLEYQTALKSIGLCFHIILSNDKPVENPHVGRSLGLVCVSGVELAGVFASKVPAAVLFQAIRRQTEIEFLCPFNTTHIARGAMFRGRKSEFERLTFAQDTHFAVTGARNIGKTSLLHKSEALLTRNESTRDRSFLYDCRNWRQSVESFQLLTHSIDPRREVRIAKGWRNVMYLLERQSRGGSPAHRLLIFLDETDGLIEADAAAGWPFFRVLAEAMGKSYIRLVLAGFRSVFKLTDHQVADDTNSVPSPLFGSLQPITLAPLHQSEARELIVDPLASAGVDIAGQDEFFAKVWHYTRGYPFFLQFFGVQLYGLATSAGNRLEPTDVDRVAYGSEIHTFLMEHFMQNTRDVDQVCTLERLIVFTMIHSEREAWVEGDFIDIASRHGRRIDDIPKACRNLLMTGVLEFSGNHYRVAVPLLAETLRISFPPSCLPQLLATLTGT